MVKSTLTCSLSPRILISRLHRSVYPSAKLLFASSSLNFRRPCSLYSVFNRVMAMVEREVVDFGFFWAIVAAGLALIFRLPTIQVASLVSIYRLSGAEVLSYRCR